MLGENISAIFGQTMGLLIKNIKGLVLVEKKARKIVAAKDMQELNILDNAWLMTDGKRIGDFGSMDTCPSPTGPVLDAETKFVFPCWCDSHTHLVYAASRESEFVDRIKGLSYEEIAKKGGGILNSATQLNETPEEELLEQAYLRLGEIKDFGTGAVEIKSGYGLTLDSELKMLRVIKKLKSISELTIKSTFLGAHAMPASFKDSRESYIKLLIEEMLPKIAEEELADYIDVFCDEGFYTPQESEQIIEAGAKYGLKAKIHVNELANSGGVQIGVKHGVLSVDHLENIGEEEIKVLKQSSGTIPCIMPGVAFFLNMEYAPARKLIDEGIPIALASDYNPGSTPSGNMPLVLALACLKLSLLPSEAINAATLNGAYAMELSDSLGSIAKGKIANLFITKKIPSVEYLAYSYGSRLVETVILNGQVQ